MLMPGVDPRLDALIEACLGPRPLVHTIENLLSRLLGATMWKLWSIWLEAISLLLGVLVNCTLYDMYYAVRSSGLTQWVFDEWRLLPGFLGTTILQYYVQSW